MISRALVPLLAALSLAACASHEPDFAAPDIGKQLHVDHVRVQYTPAFAPGSTELSFTEATRLQSFVDQAALRPNDHVYVAAAPGDPLAAARIGGIAKMLARRGVGVETVAPPASGVEPNHVAMMVDRYTVAQPACPDWSDAPDTGHDNMPNSNFGCATMTDLSLMVDNPRDLEQGRRPGLLDAEPATNAVARLRADAVKPFIAQTSSQPATNINLQTSTGGSGSGATGGSSPGGSTGQ